MRLFHPNLALLRPMVLVDRVRGSCMIFNDFPGLWWCRETFWHLWSLFSLVLPLLSIAGCAKRCFPPERSCFWRMSCVGWPMRSRLISNDSQWFPMILLNALMSLNLVLSGLDFVWHFWIRENAFFSSEVGVFRPVRFVLVFSRFFDFYLKQKQYIYLLHMAQVSGGHRGAGTSRQKLV